MREIDMIVIHCSATRCDRDYTFESLDNDHRSRGWNGCGYHRYITKDGTVHIGRPYEQVGAHVGPRFNPHSIGICYEGGLNAKGQFDDTRTVAQKRSMAKLIRDLKARFPKARILGHRDLPGVHKACPCYDVGADLNGEKPSQSLKTLPQIRGRPMPGVQKPAPDLRDISARCAETRLRFEGHLCPVCRNMPQIQGTFMPGVQKPAPDSRDIYARCAETCPRFKAHLCTVCIVFPQI